MFKSCDREACLALGTAGLLSTTNKGTKLKPTEMSWSQRLTMVCMDFLVTSCRRHRIRTLNCPLKARPQRCMASLHHPEEFLAHAG